MIYFLKNNFSLLISYLSLLFVYSGLIKWINFPADPTLITGLILFIIIIFFKKRIIISSESILLIIFFMLYIFTSIYTISKDYWITKSSTLLVSLLAFLIPFSCFNTLDSFQRLKKSLNILSLLAIIILIWILITNNWITLIQTRDYDSKIPNYLSIGTFLSSFIIINFSNNKVYIRILQILSIALLLMLGGRGPIIFLVLCFVIYRIIISQLKISLYFNFIIIGFIIYYMYNNFEIFELLRYRIGLISSDLRFEQFDKSIEIIQNNLIIGVGIGGYGIAEGNIDQVSYPHNFILEIFAETGIFISTIMIIFLLYFFIKRYLILRINEFGIQIYLVSFYLFLQAMKSGGIVDIRMLLFWVGCTITYAKIYKKFNNFITK